MARNTSVSLGDHFTGFVSRQVAAGRYGPTSEVLRAACGCWRRATPA